MKILYSFSIHLYHAAIRTASLFNPKAKLWVEGRRNIFQKIASELKPSTNGSQLIWFHCASLGEFEQGRTVMEKLKKQDPEIKILLTFFSPSGYEIRKNYEGADYVLYLPIGTRHNAERFVKLIKPKAVFFVKYEFWFNYLNELKNQKVPVYLISGIFREDQYFFKWYSRWFREQLNRFTHFYLQDEESKKLLNSIGYTNITVSGDTRFDRVFEIAENVKSISLIEKFKQDKQLLVAGSTWEEDEKIISDLKFHASGFKLIIVPHEIDESHIQLIESIFIPILRNGLKDGEGAGRACLRYSQADDKNITTASVLIIDNIGMLSSIYQYASIAYVGGGFGKGIHNILEPAAFGLPVIFGPNYNKFTEAIELIQAGGAFSFSSRDELKNIFNFLKAPAALKKTSEISKSYVSSRIGATDKILKSISLQKNKEIIN